MPLYVSCPQCGNHGELPDESQGTDILCEVCGGVCVSGNTAPDHPILPSLVQQKPHLSTQKKCRFCAELIKFEAKVCRFCNRNQSSEKADGDTKFFSGWQVTVIFCVLALVLYFATRTTNPIVTEAKNANSSNPSEPETPVEQPKVSKPTFKKTDLKRTKVIERLNALHRAVSTGVNLIDFTKATNDLRYDFNAWVRTVKVPSKDTFAVAVNHAANTAELATSYWKMKIDHHKEGGLVVIGKSEKDIFSIYPEANKPVDQGGAIMRLPAFAFQLEGGRMNDMRMVDNVPHLSLESLVQIMLNDLTRKLEVAVEFGGESDESED